MPTVLAPWSHILVRLAKLLIALLIATKASGGPLIAILRLRSEISRCFLLEFCLILAKITGLFSSLAKVFEAGLVSYFGGILLHRVNRVSNLEGH